MRTVPVPEGEGISLSLSEISEGMPLQIMVATDNISLRIVFDLVHHDLSSHAKPTWLVKALLADLYDEYLFLL